MHLEEAKIYWGALGASRRKSERFPHAVGQIFAFQGESLNLKFFVIK